MENSRGSVPSKSWKRRVALVSGVVVVVGAAALTGTAGKREPVADNAPTSRPAATPGTPAAPSGFADFHGPGFVVGYPSDWTRLAPGDPSVALLATGGADSFMVRVLRLPAPVDPAALPPARPFTDEIQRSSESVRLLEPPKRITLAGLPGYFYFYTFRDAASGRIAAHSHFFLFAGRQVISLVFQALPADRFPADAALFDRITASFRPG